MKELRYPFLSTMIQLFHLELSSQKLISKICLLAVLSEREKADHPLVAPSIIQVCCFHHSCLCISGPLA